MTAWSFFPAQEGGPSNALYWLASGLSKAGYEMRVVTTNRYLPEGCLKCDEWLTLNGFNVIYQSNYEDTIVFEKELNDCDVYLTDGVCKLAYFRQVCSALKKNKRVVLSPRGEIFDSAIDHKGKAYGLMKRLFLFVMKWSVGKRILFHATSEEELEAVKKYFGKKAKVILIPNYMILPNKITTVSLEPYLLYLGRLNQIKNIDKILSGLARSSAFMNGSFVLKLAGETKGEYYESLVKQTAELGLEKKVEFLGLVTGKEKDVLYANAKCLLLMSKSENFGNVIVEALSQGTPVIASKGTPWQLLDEKGAGWWIDAVPDEIAKTVDKLLLLDDKQYSEMRDYAYRYSREFDIYENINRWKEVIDTL